MSKSARMKINGDSGKEKEKPCLLTTETESEGEGVVNNVGSIVWGQVLEGSGKQKKDLDMMWQ